jgi:hypothetical protein
VDGYPGKLSETVLTTVLDYNSCPAADEIRIKTCRLLFLLCFLKSGKLRYLCDSPLATDYEAVGKMVLEFGEFVKMEQPKSRLLAKEGIRILNSEVLHFFLSFFLSQQANLFHPGHQCRSI